jgi:predicted ATPase with chaperone activity
MGQAIARHGNQEYRRRTDARNLASNDELLKRLVDAAFDVLQHDADEALEPEQHEIGILRRKFAKILKIDRFTP